MPEIAEVETVRKTLKKQILNKKIKDVHVLYDGIIMGDISEFKNVLIGNSFNDIDRIGKWLIFKLNGYSLLSHLRMEGKYFLKEHDDKIVKHEHVIITFDDNTDLRYHDTRKFGKMKVVREENLITTKEISKQGMEPNSSGLTKEYLYNSLKNKSLPIKTLLLDQTIISGLGNIYANEVLFDSQINPSKKGNDLTLEECEHIVLSSNKIIAKAIEEGGTTIKSYTSSLGVTGRFQQFLKVHKREDEKCYNCGAKIMKIKINGRSTYFCPNCQK